MDGILELNLSHLEVHSLPPNTTSLMQPLDAGIIAALKCRYRLLQFWRVLDLDDLGKDDIYKVYIFQAICWISSHWMMLPSPVTGICWRHTSLVPATSTLDIEIERQVEEEIRDLTSEGSEVVAEHNNLISISHFLCHPSENDTVENLSENNLLDFPISSH